MGKTLFLIDGHAQIFRAYFAIRGGLTSPSGEPTQALFGFTGMLLKLLSQNKPEYAVMAIDSPGPTFRDELFDDYKGTRPPAPDDLVAQIPRILELTELFGLKVIGVPGLEADDIIATITRHVLEHPELGDYDVRIVSRDKDLEQLLCERVALYDIHTDETVDTAGLLAKKGIRPDQVIDYLSLTGDTADNVPGVPGIGPKTAAQLLQQFDTVEGIMANVAQIKGKRGETLSQSEKQLALARRLVTLETKGDFPFVIDDARVRPLRLETILARFAEFGFNRYQAEVKKLVGEAAAAAEPAEALPAAVPDGAPLPGEPAVQPASPPVPRGTYRAITTEAALAELVDQLRAQQLFSFDTETTGLGDGAALCGLSLAWEPEKGVYIPVRSPEPRAHLDESTVLAALRPLFEDPGLGKCGHNVKFDAGVLLRNGVRLRGVVCDSLLASQLIDPSQSSHKLDDLARRWLGYEMVPITQLIGEGDQQASMDSVPLAQITDYAAEDADVALRLYRRLAPILAEHELEALLRDVESPLAVVLAEMEHAGIRCDPDELKRQGEALGARVDELQVEILGLCGTEFNIDSPPQLAEVLFEKLGLPPGKKTKTGFSTDIEVLTDLASQEDPDRPETRVPGLIIEYRQLRKLISTYIGALGEAIRPETGRIHSTFHQLVTATGRLASHGPNLQNIPVRTSVGRQLRKAFTAPEEHVFICADYSQIELRLLAHLSGDEGLTGAFRDGLDIHAAVAAQVFGTTPEAVTPEQRSRAKVINFGIIYGITPFGLSRRIHGLDIGEAKRLIDDYKARFRGIDVFLQSCVQQGLDRGYVTTILGRRRAIPELKAKSRPQRALGERLAINSVVQGSAADLIKLAMVNVQRRIDRDQLPLRLLLQIHDELVLETPATLAETHAAIVREEMERALALDVPLVAEAGIGPDWLSAK